MTISCRVRFEVLKRDRFQCQYCGRSAPEVLLEVDHVVPRAAGGDDDQSNLRASCQDCNRGKSARMLEEGASAVSQEAVDEMRSRAERIARQDAYQEARRSYEAAMQLRLDAVWEAWCDAWGGYYDEVENMYRSPRVNFPWDSVVRDRIETLGVGRVLEAVEVTRLRCRRSYGSHPAKYFSGVLRNWDEQAMEER